MKYQRKDAHYRRAKAEGFRARSAYKLAELDDRYQLFAKGDRVADLGAWPGGWLQVAVERIGPTGRVVGVDLTPLEKLPAGNVKLLVGDVRDPDLPARVGGLLGGPADVVISDVAPKLTGVRDTDEARCAELVGAVLDAVPRLAKPGATALVKLFMDAGYREHVARMRTMFREVKTTRPEASRRGSSELYAVAHGLRGGCG